MDESGPNTTEADDSSAELPDDDDNWDDYYAATRDYPPRPMLARAAGMLPGPGKALDLGCGAGNDTRYLLEHGFRVTAVDANQASVSALLALGEERLKAVLSTFAEFTFDSDGYDLISAQYALPFSPPDGFAGMFARLVSALRPGAIFTGQLFGVRDAWNEPGTDLSFHTRAEAEQLLHGLHLIEFHETEEAVLLASGDPHNAHYLEFIARRPTTSERHDAAAMRQ
jgi:SAM-dependent methyltransferase